MNERSEQVEFEVDEMQRQSMRANLSTLSFEDLIKLKEKLGSKVYNGTVYGMDIPTKIRGQKEVRRANKNRPREISSKIKLKEMKTILSKSSCSSLFKAKLTRDPRFDPSCGELDKISFKQNYGFVNEFRQQERVELQKTYKECTDPKTRKTISLLIQRMDNQNREEERKAKEQQKEDYKKREIRENLKRGEQHRYKKKSVEKVEVLVEKYEELKKANLLKKHIERRAKKLKVKDRRAMANIK